MAKELGTLEEAGNESQKTGGSKASGKTGSKKELVEFFNKVKTEKSAVISSKGSFYRRKIMHLRDLGNPRYNADKPRSCMGLLVGQKTRPNGFAEIKEEPTMETITKEEGSPELEDKAESEIDEEETNDEITFHGFDEDTVNDMKSIAPQEEDINSVINTRDVVSKGVAGHTLQSWGTGCQGGMRLGPSPTASEVRFIKTKSRVGSIGYDERATNVGSEVGSSVLSHVPSTVISNKCRDLQSQLTKQRQNREMLQKQIDELREQCFSNER